MDSSFTDIINRIYEDLNEKDEIRETLLKLSRELTRMSGRIIQFIINEQHDRVEEHLRNALRVKNKISDIITKNPWYFGWKGVNAGFEEYSEALILWGIAQEKRIPEPNDLNVPSEVYILGLGDVIGELRRLLLRALIKHDTEKAKQYMTYMNEMYYALVEMDFSKALIPNLRHKIDRARAILDKTEGDLTYALISQETMRNLKELQHD